MTYAWEQFHMAIHSLAGLGTIHERLANAYALHLLHVDPQELPDEIQEVFERQRKDLTAMQPVGDESAVDATVHRMADEEALNHVETIIAMYDTVARKEGSF